MLSNKKVMEMLQQASNVYAEFLSSPILNYKPRTVKVNDIFYFLEDDCEGRTTGLHMKLMSNKDKLYLIDCDKNGETRWNLDFKDYQPLNSFSIKELDSFICGMMDVAFTK